MYDSNDSFHNRRQQKTHSALPTAGTPVECKLFVGLLTQYYWLDKKNASISSVERQRDRDRQSQSFKMQNSTKHIHCNQINSCLTRIPICYSSVHLSRTYTHTHTTDCGYFIYNVYRCWLCEKEKKSSKKNISKRQNEKKPAKKELRIKNS